MTAKVLHS
jgi:ribonuclease HI